MSDIQSLLYYKHKRERERERERENGRENEWKK